jgi:hypothetical protein
VTSESTLSAPPSFPDRSLATTDARLSSIIFTSG